MYLVSLATNSKVVFCFAVIGDCFEKYSTGLALMFGLARAFIPRRLNSPLRLLKLPRKPLDPHCRCHLGCRSNALRGMRFHRSNSPCLCSVDQSSVHREATPPPFIEDCLPSCCENSPEHAIHHQSFHMKLTMGSQPHRLGHLMAIG